MIVNKAWNNYQVTLWQVADNDPDYRLFRGYVNAGVRLKNRREIGDACRYCGSPLKPGENCVQCGGPAGGGFQRMGVAELTIRSVMPFAQFLMFLPDSVTFELTRRECGRRDVFNPDQVFMRLVDMKMVRCEMPDLSGYYDEQAIVNVEVVLEGQAQMLILDEEKESL